LRDEKEEGRSESALDDAPAVVGLAGQAAVAQDEAEAALVVRAVSIGICRMGLVERIAAASRPNVILVEHLGCLCISRGNAQSALGAGELGLEFALTQAVLGLLLTAKLLERIEGDFGANTLVTLDDHLTDCSVAIVFESGVAALNRRETPLMTRDSRDDLYLTLVGIFGDASSGVELLGGRHSGEFAVGRANRADLCGGRVALLPDLLNSEAVGDDVPAGEEDDEDDPDDDDSDGE